MKRHLLLCLLLFGGQALAMEAIDTDGPDFVESSEVVPLRYIQYELGLGSSSGSPNSVQSSTAETPLLLRYGVAKDWELRVQSDGYISQNGDRGVGTTAFGFKYRSQGRDLKTGVPAIAWIFHLETPLASPVYRNNGIFPSLRSVITWDLINDFSVAIMPGVAKQVNSAGEAFTGAIFGAVLGKRLSDKTRVFIELSVPTISQSSQAGIIASGDIGAAYLITNDTQVGFRAGLGLNTNSPRQYILFELAQRY
jgi:hypothetical protein